MKIQKELKNGQRIIYKHGQQKLRCLYNGKQYELLTIHQANKKKDSVPTNSDTLDTINDLKKKYGSKN